MNNTQKTSRKNSTKSGNLEAFKVKFDNVARKTK